MSEALFGLLGTAVGGLAAFGGSWIAARYEYKEQRLAVEKETERQQDLQASERRDQKVTRYATFLAAYYSEEARIVEIIEEIRKQRDGWSRRITDTIDEPRRAEDQISSGVPQ